MNPVENEDRALRPFMVLSFCLAFLWPLAGRADTVCPEPREAGHWEVSEKAQLGELTKLEVRHDCTETGKEVWHIRALASCHPRDCTWGVAAAHLLKGRLVAVFETFTAERWISLRLDGDSLNADVYIKPHNGKRKPTRYSRQMVRDR